MIECVALADGPLAGDAFIDHTNKRAQKDLHKLFKNLQNRFLKLIDKINP